MLDDGHEVDFVNQTSNHVGADGTGLSTRDRLHNDAVGEFELVLNEFVVRELLLEVRRPLYHRLKAVIIHFFSRLL